MDEVLTAVYEGDETNKDTRHQEYNHTGSSVVSRWPAADIFDNVKSMSLNDVVECHKYDRQTKANRYVDEDLATFLSILVNEKSCGGGRSRAYMSFGGGDSPDRRYLVETAIDAQRGGRKGSAKPDNELCS